MAGKKTFLVFLIILSIISLITLFQVYPIGFIAVESAGLRDVTILYKGKPYSEIELNLPVSRLSTFCYEKIFKISNMGYADLVYRLSVDLDKNVSSGFIKVLTDSDLVFVMENGRVLVDNPVVLKPHEEKSVKICLKNLLQEIKLSFFDERVPRQTTVRVAIKPRLTDWYDKDFPRRIILKPVVGEEGIGLFEIKADGEILFNGESLLQIRPFIGERAGSFLIVLKSMEGTYLVPYQAERWVKDITGVERPLRLLGANESLEEGDRVVFKVFVSNSSEIQIYMGGRTPAKFETDLRGGDNYVLNDYMKVTLNDAGFVQDGISVNVSGYIIYPYQNKRVRLHEKGVWKKAFIGPVRAVYIFTTEGLTRAPMTAVLCVYSYSNITWTTVYPGLFENRRIVLEWVSPIVSGAWRGAGESFHHGNYHFLLVSGSTARRLPLRAISRGDRLEVVLASNFYLEGGSTSVPTVYGYYSYAVSGLRLGRVRNVAIRYEKLSWGVTP